LSGAPLSPELYESTCAQEPIHIPGSIQPHGLLIVLSEPELIITNVSANAETLLRRSPAAVCGAPLAAIFGAPQADRLTAAIRRGDLAAINPMRFSLSDAGARAEFECAVHRAGNAVIVEFEPFDRPAEHGQFDLFAHVRTPIAHMEGAPDIASLLSGAAADVGEISGFDRVMIYRFDEDWNGEVVAEVTGGALPKKYLGLRFPAADIPEQARRLYAINPLRLVPDARYEPAALVPPENPATGLAVDLSRAILRSVSPVHREYLQNMGVRATMTISILIEGRLWGLIACHHARPRRIDHGTRAVCALLGQMLAWQLGSRLTAQRLQKKLHANALIGSNGIALNGQNDLGAGLIAGAQDLLELFAAQGLVVRLDGAFRRFGTTPDDAAVAEIAAALKLTAEGGIAANHRIATLVPEAVPEAASTCGALLIALSESGDEYVLCLRQEVVQTVRWGGDIRAAVTERGGTLHPRTSFALWEQTVRGQSLRWLEHDLTSAQNLRRRILDRLQTIDRGRAEERIRYLARHDPLTQLPNRASFHHALLRALVEAEREGGMLAVLFVDLDHFKVFNEAFGHSTGDQILQAAGARLQDCVRHDDIVARLGGDEFVILSGKLASERSADLVAGKILAAISQPFLVEDRPEIRFTASVGIAVYPKDSHDGEALLQRADLAMHRAKERGRNGFQRFDFGDAGPTYERLTFERRIQEGLGRSEFVPYYQPVMDLRSGRIIATEALARWNHPELGLLLPARFIRISEESRLIVTLGEAMLRAACAQTAWWRTLAGYETLRVSVNVSARQFREHTFLRTVQEIVAQTGLAPEALQLELTETLLIGDEEYAIRTLHALADAGIRIAIDDFGTGYSSLSYLKRLPVDVLKIDQSFIRDLSARADDTAIVRAIIAMAHSLKLAVVAEGVETFAQLEFLRTEQCEAVQGYLVARPLAHADATAFMSGFDFGRLIAETASG
jgi:diguanylate cyclase (GGDEF)-like protein